MSDPTRDDAERVDAVRQTDERAPLDAAALDAIEARANRGCRCDNDDCVTQFVQLVNEDVPALIAEVKRMRAERVPLTNEYGIRATYISTFTMETAVADTLGGALDELARFDAQGRGDMVSRELIQRPVGEWRKVGDGDV